MRNRYGTASQQHRSCGLRYGACRAGVVCTFAVIASVAFASGGELQTAPQTTSFLLESGKAGPFEIGATVDEIYRLVGRDHVRLVDLFTEGMFNPALEIQLPGANAEPKIIVQIREWPCSDFSAWGILIRDRRFRTREGIGIGSTLNEMRRHYQVKVMPGEGSYVAFVPSLDLSFELDAIREPTDLSKIKSVWVPPQPREVRKRRCPHLGPLP
jgi:hypothetical protein